MHGHQIEHELAQLVLTPKDAQSVSQLFYGPNPRSSLHRLSIPPSTTCSSHGGGYYAERCFITVLTPFIFQHLSLRVKVMHYLQFLETYFSAHVRHGPIAHDPKAGPRNSRHASPAR